MSEKKLIANTTQVLNVISDEYMADMTGSELKCYLLINRKTTGWHKPKDGISISQFEKFTGISKRHTVNQAINSLLEKGLISAIERPGKPTLYGLNLTGKQTETPAGNGHTPETVTHADNGHTTHAGKRHTTHAGKRHTTHAGKRHTQNQLTKPTNKTNSKKESSQSERKGDSPKPARLEKPKPDYPPGLNIEAWETWVAFRREAGMKKYKTDRMANSLARYPPEVQAQAVEHSMANEYQGVFPEKFTRQENANGHDAKRKSKSELYWEQLLDIERRTAATH